MSAGNVTIASYLKFLKNFYTKQQLQTMASMEKPLLGDIGKEEGWGGNGVLVVPIDEATPQGHSATFSNAQANISTGVQQAFTTTAPKAHEGVIRFSDQVLRMSAKGDATSYGPARTRLVNGLIDSVSHYLAGALYGTTSGSLGKGATLDGSNTTFTLNKKSDAYRFKKDMVLQANDTDNATSPRAGTRTVTGVNTALGTVTVNSDVTTDSWAATDYLFLDGSMGTSIAGLPSWLGTPSTAPTSIFGVTQTGSEILSGHRVDNAGQPIQDSIDDLMMAITSLSIHAKPTKCYLSPRGVRKLARESNNKVQRMDGGKAKLGWSGFQILTTKGMIDIVQDPFCPDDVGYVISPSTWKFYSVDSVPHFKEGANGDRMYLRPDANAYEVRVGWYGELMCNFPGANGCFAVSV